MMRHYLYIGPADIRRAVAAAPAGTTITSYHDLDAWTRNAQSWPPRTDTLIATFVVNEAGFLCLADRHSEHVACARGQPVLSAGEITLVRSRDGWEVSEISNQSTGYCPEPESWPSVAYALDSIGIPHPDYFTALCIFRRCLNCRQIAIVKDDVYRCEVCGSELPKTWNLAL